tara:strand:+ start:572 stop:802 length:231 start_codon:yes stop_codon:yes gene_type:complete
MIDMTYIYNDRRYDLMTERMDRVKEYMICKLIYCFKSKESGFEDTYKATLKKLNRASECFTKLSNKRERIKYGKEV